MSAHSPTVADDSTAISVSVSSSPAVFSCTDFSLEVLGEQYRWHTAGKFQKYLAERHGVICPRVVKESGQGSAFLLFHSAAERDAAVESLNAAKHDKTGKPLWKIRQGPYKNVDDYLAKQVALDEKFEQRRKRRSEKREKKRKERNANTGSQENESEQDSASDSGSNSDSESAGSGPDAKRQRSAPTMEEAVTPYARYPYHIQLMKKTRYCNNMLRKCLVGLRKEFRGYESPFIKGRQLCALEPIVGSPVLESYRNKSEFTCGLNANGEPTCGFLVGSFKDGITSVESADSCLIVPSIAKLIARFLTEFMRSHPQYKPYMRESHTGVWRIITVKNSQLNQLLITVQIDPTGIEESELKELKRLLAQGIAQRFRDYKASHPEETEISRYELKGLQLMIWSGISNAAPEGCPLELIDGDSANIFERLFDLDFRLGHYSFFQVNVKAAELLFSKAAEWAQCGPSTTLLDICCGTGTIGLSLASKVKKVIGLEIVEAAIEDAKENAKRNGIENAVYIAGKAEDTIWEAIKIFDKHKVDAVVAAAKASIASGATFVAPASDPDVNLVGIVDPPRSGLHPTVVKALRSCNKLNRLVYVSCNPSSLAANLHYFLQPPSKRYRGRPFVATRAAAFDLFPHTKHCEMIVLLEREELKPQNTNAAAAAAPAEASTAPSASEAPQPQ